ncbi:MAG: hypothetical protein QOH06_5109 [Acidobacteriota bacterium]|jgi:hypothetical protein|nr:hypothetical protein [Acidobacteriota bacterium]
MPIELEFHEVADLPGLEQLWREETDWGEETLRNLHRWFMEAPYGKPRIVVARDSRSGAIVGQFRFMPSLVSVDGREVRAHRPFGTIITKEMRQGMASLNPLKQPAVAMYLHAVRELQERGEQLIYMVPDPRWVRLFKMFSFLQTGSFPLWSRALPLAAPLPLGEGFEAAELAAWEPEAVDRLWQSSRGLHGCMSVRDTATLRWKLANARYTVTAVRREGELAALVASRAKGDRQWLVCDLLAADAGPALRAALAAAANAAHEESLVRSGAEEIRKVAVLATQVLEPVVRELGFERDDYDFPIVTHVLDGSLQPEEVAPSRWYVSAND